MTRAEEIARKIVAAEHDASLSAQDDLMKLTAIMPVKNESWVLGFSVRVALLWCDQVVALNHGSTDNSRQILEEIAVESGGRVLIADDDSPGWPEMVQRQRLLDLARNYSATHIALIDADEVLAGDGLPYVRKHVETIPPGRCLNVNMYCMWRGLHQFRSDPGSVWSNRRDLALAFHDAPRLEWAAAADGYQHHARAPRHSIGFRNDAATPLGVMHLQFADWRRLIAKHALYKVRERIAYPAKPVGEIERLYNMAPDERGIQVTATPAAWLAPYRELVKYLDLKAEPWQAAEVCRLIKEHGPRMFEGLDLFGVA